MGKFLFVEIIGRIILKRNFAQPGKMKIYKASVGCEMPNLKQQN